MHSGNPMKPHIPLDKLSTLNSRAVLGLNTLELNGNRAGIGRNRCL